MWRTVGDQRGKEAVVDVVVGVVLPLVEHLFPRRIRLRRYNIARPGSKFHCDWRGVYLRNIVSHVCRKRRGKEGMILGFSQVSRRKKFRNAKQVAADAK